MRQFTNRSKSHFELTRRAIEMYTAEKEGLEMIEDFTTEPLPRIPVPAWKAATLIPARPYLQEQEEQEYYDRCQRQWEVLQEERRQDSCPFSFDTEFGQVDLGYYEEVYGA